MKKIIVSTGLCLALLLSGMAHAKTKTAVATAKPAPTVTEQLNYVVKRAGNLHLGIMVKNLNTGQMIYQLNTDDLYVPASNLKVFTAVAALEYLTPDFHYQTSLVSTSARVNQGVLLGNVYAIFAGDPSLTRQDINDLFKQLKQKGINKIAGNLYIDDQLFDTDGKVPAALPEDATYCFSAPVASDTIDHNCVGVKAQPSLRLNAPAIVSFIQPLNSATLLDEINTGRGRSCNITVTSENNNAYLLNGCIPYKSRTQEFSLPVQNMRFYTSSIIQLALKNAQIHLDGRILFAKPQVPVFTVASHQSDPLAVLVRHMLKQSDNLYANSILKTLGAHYFGTVGSWQSGTSAVKVILLKYNGVNTASARLVDGAGLSRENMITPAQMMQVLTTAYHNPQIAAAFMQALPIGGVDGTLKGRMGEGAYRSRVHAKTGTMSDVSSLSGYIQTHKKQTLAFTILVNDTTPHPGKYRNIEDTVCKILILNF